MMDHFDLRTRPFTREIDTKSCVDLPFLNEPLRDIVATIRARMSALICAPPGFGKTVLLRRIKANLPEARYKVTYLNVPRLTGRDLCREVARAVGAVPAGNFPTVVRSISKRLVEALDQESLQYVLMLDDAQALTTQGFELIKILTNFDMDSKLIVSIVLAGHPLLKERLLTPSLTDIRQRMNHCASLRALGRDEVKSYIAHRFMLAGKTEPPLDPSAIELTYELSRGNMRAIDNIMLKSLDVASAKGDKTLTSSHIAIAGEKLWT